jgi:hypothetical protein
MCVKAWSRVSIVIDCFAFNIKEQIRIAVADIQYPANIDRKQYLSIFLDFDNCRHDDFLTPHESALGTTRSVSLGALLARETKRERGLASLI